MKRYWILFGILVLLIAVSTTGCGGEPTVAPRSDAASAARGTNSPEFQKSPDSGIDLKPTREEVTMTPPPGNPPSDVTPPPEAEQVVRLAVEDLSKRLGLAPGEIRLVSVEAVEWRDASLGCPQPGMMYAQVITPGFRVVLEAGGQEYNYHTDMDRFVVLCEEGGETSGATRGGTLSGEPNVSDLQDSFLDEMVTKAKEDLADQFSIELDQINLLEVREVTWPDSSLGCPQPGMVYSQVPQEGLLIRLGVGDRMYFYHSGGSQDPFLCEDSSRIVPKVTPKTDEFVPPPDSEID